MSLFDDLAQQFSKTNSAHIGQAIEQMVSTAISKRKMHERRWFDNNYFDDGLHFRIVSKRTGRIIDHISYANGYIERAIPRASRQIRGVANLLFSAEPYPVVYPERVSLEDFRDPTTGQVNTPSYQQRMDDAKHIARRQGNWLATQWDDLELGLKLIDMILLAAKNSVSYCQIYSDTDNEQIKLWVGDAWDVILYGDRRELKDEPFITKAAPMDLIDIYGNPLFDPAKVKDLKPDNRYATSEIKDAYMRSRYGTKSPDSEHASSVIVKETFMKEPLTDENWKQAQKLDTGGAMEGKKRGDQIMRHVFSAGGVTLRDEYIDYDEYPIVDFRFEPGLIYQTPFIERFIPQNKSIDVIATRIEKFVNSMAVGVYQKRKGENFQISNFPGGQVMEFETTPLTQMNLASPGNAPFEVISMMDKYIDEQGTTTASGINVPQGVKSGVAIESVKATEYANLKIPTLMLKKTIKEISERMLERADKDFMEPHETSFLEDGEPQYFDVIGQRGLNLSMQVNKSLPANIVPLRKDLKVRIEIEPGLGLTMEGKKQAMQQIIDYTIKMAQFGIYSPEALKMIVKRFMDVFGYGSTQEFMEILDQQQPGDLTEEQITKMKVAIAETLKDTGAVGPAADQKLVDSTKVGVLESLQQSGIMDRLTPPAQEKVAINYKDAPPDIQRQMEQQAGFIPSQTPSPSEIQSKAKVAETVIKAKQVSNQESYPISKFRKGGQNGSSNNPTA